MLTTSRLLKLFIILSLLLCQVQATTVYLIRHAEKAAGADPALTACGQARASALAAYFKAVPLSAVYATPYQRTQQTAAVIAQSQQLVVNSYHPAQPAQLQQQLSQHSAAVFIVGHSNTVPALVTLLSGIAVAPLTEQDYDLLYEVKLGDAPSVTIRRQGFHCPPARADVAQP